VKQCKITVLKRTLNLELAKQFLKAPVGPCELFQEGQEFIFSSFTGKPQGFCDWAWNDIYKVVVTLARGGNFSHELFEDWMQEEQAMITCCTDGIRPVIFKVEMIQAQETV
jgi:uncharacterized repeat protein (TIGR04076 family)